MKPYGCVLEGSSRLSEPRQLYASVRLSRAKLDAFLASALPDPSEDREVLAWLDTACYYGDRYTPELIRERISSQPTVGEWVDELLAPAHYGFAMPSRNSYDDASQTWTLAVLDFSENYDDYLAAVAVFRQIAKYKDLTGDDGMLIYAHLFDEDDHPEVALRIGPGSATFLDESTAASLISDANVAMEALMEEGQRGASSR